MARKVNVILTDDLSDTEVPADETVTFGVDGERYEIDLTSDNAKVMRDMLGRYVKAARNVTRQSKAGRSHTTRTTSRSGMDREQTRRMREWARNNGWPELAERGRVPAEVQEAFHSNTPRTTSPKAEQPEIPNADAKPRPVRKEKVGGEAKAEAPKAEPAKEKLPA
jgi:uncharacterized membrane protein